MSLLQLHGPRLRWKEDRVCTPSGSTHTEYTYACAHGEPHRPSTLKLSSSWPLEPLVSQLHAYTHTYVCIYTYTDIQYARTAIPPVPGTPDTWPL